MSFFVCQEQRSNERIQARIAATVGGPSTDCVKAILSTHCIVYGPTIIIFIEWEFYLNCMTTWIWANHRTCQRMKNDSCGGCGIQSRSVCISIDLLIKWKWKTTQQFTSFFFFNSTATIVTQQSTFIVETVNAVRSIDSPLTFYSGTHTVVEIMPQHVCAPFSNRNEYGW